MSSKAIEFTKSKQINPPKWLLDPGRVIYEVLTGSQAYGISTEDSDFDVYSLVIPPKEIVFPHLDGYIVGFDKDYPTFTTYQNREGTKLIGADKREYDIQIYSIITFFNLAAENNPNIIDSLFVGENCVLYCNDVGRLLRDNRKIFLNKNSLWKFIGYAYSQQKLMKSKTEKSKRYSDILEFNYDRKAAANIIRLLNECWQILATGDLSLTSNNDMLKEIRRGEWSEERIRKYFEVQEPLLKSLYETSHLPYSPPMDKIKKLLLECLEASYGTLCCASCALNYETVTNNTNHKIIQQIRELVK